MNALFRFVNTPIQQTPFDIAFSIGVGSSVLIAVLLSVGYLFSPKYDYTNKHVLVTGGSSGIGLEIAKEMIKQKARVTIVARDPKKLKFAQQELQVVVNGVKGKNKDALFPSIDIVSLDTSSSQENVDNGLKDILQRQGDCDVLINCAGTSIAGEFLSTPTSEFQKMFSTNVLGSIYPTYTVLPGMIKRGGGRVVFVSSQVAQAALYGYTAYGASKWSLRGIAEALQSEVKPYNIYVSVAYPPDTDTPGYQVEMETKPKLTRLLSESGSVFSASQVAKDIVHYARIGYFGISSGLDGWLLKQVHPGMTPCNNIVEVVQGVLLTPLCRAIALFVITGWDRLISRELKNNKKKA